MAKKRSFEDRNKKVVGLFNEFLPQWLESYLEPKSNAWSFVYEGRSIKTTNLYSTFRNFLICKNIYDSIPPRYFLVYVQTLLQAKKVVYYKHRFAVGLVA